MNPHSKSSSDNPPLCKMWGEDRSGTGIYLGEEQDSSSSIWYYLGTKECSC